MYLFKYLVPNLDTSFHPVLESSFGSRFGDLHFLNCNHDSFHTFAFTQSMVFSFECNGAFRFVNKINIFFIVKQIKQNFVLKATNKFRL